MKPQDFVREYSRLCDAYRLPQEFACKKNCPFNAMGCTFSENVNINHPERFEKAYNIVEKWSDTHPVKTRQSEFLKKFPYTNLKIITRLLPCSLDGTLKPLRCAKYGYLSITCRCDKCRDDYWNEEVGN